MNQTNESGAEQTRLQEDREGRAAWKKWGPYLSERQRGTVREDYSSSGDAWNYFTHDNAQYRAYRWGEDGLAGISDNRQLLCFALALWNGRDPILKERLFGLSNSEGNHGEDVKEYYFYLDTTPTHSYMKYLYKYAQAQYPYQLIIEANRTRDKQAADGGAYAMRNVRRQHLGIILSELTDQRALTAVWTLRRDGGGAPQGMARQLGF